MSNKRSALVTGGSRGIGAAVALRLGQAGFDVCVGYRSNESAAADVVRRIASGGARAVSIQADLADAAAPEKLVQECESAFGRIDVLVNNAGVAPITPIDDITIPEWSNVMDTNLRATFLLSRLALERMKARKWGRIVNVASQAGLTGGFFVGAHYAASKGGMIALTKTFAKVAARGGHGVTVNCVAPGLISTDLVAGFPADATARMTAGIPMGRLGTPEEVAGVAAFLCSDEAAYITGAVIPVDGGLLAT